MIARKHYISLYQDRDAFEQAVSRDDALVGIDPAVVILLIKLALALFDWWMQNSVRVPSVIAMSDEPGWFHIDEDVELRFPE
jgi:hypothetical protein